MTTTTWKKLK